MSLGSSKSAGKTIPGQSQQVGEVGNSVVKKVDNDFKSTITPLTTPEGLTRAPNNESMETPVALNEKGDNSAKLAAVARDHANRTDL